VGLSAAATAAAIRGAICAIGSHSYFIDRAGDPMRLATDPVLDPYLPIGQRFDGLLHAAMLEAIGDSLPLLSGARLQCLIGLPEPRPGLPADLSNSVQAAVVKEFGFPSASMHVVQRGHAAGLMAIQAAAQRIQSGQADVCLAAGVDSYHDPDTLEWLDEAGLLMSSVTRNAFPPGEGAGACCIADRNWMARQGLLPLATVAAATTTFEPNAIRSSEICLGEGLTAAIQGVINTLHLPHERITASYCDINGERYRNEEYVYTLLRVQSGYVNAHDYECPADCWGDVGAASGPLFACLAIEAFQRGYDKGPRPLLWASSESGHRAAVLLTSAPG
jgi:3-oxoacyl-[acyl-carrier-protein] synthase-1